MEFVKFFLVLLRTTTCLSAMHRPRISYDIAYFKRLLAAKDYGTMRTAVEDNSWLKEEPGLSLQWRSGELALIGTQCVGEFGNVFYKGVGYGKALRTFIIKEILHPVMYGQNDLGLAMAEIDALANPLDINPSFCIFGQSDKNNTTINAIKVALCKSRDADAGKYGVSNPENTDLQKMADDIILYTGQYAGEANLLWGKLPFKIKLWANRYLLTIIGIVCIAACAGGYYCLAKKKTEEDNEEDGDIELDKNQIMND